MNVNLWLTVVFPMIQITVPVTHGNTLFLICTPGKESRPCSLGTKHEKKGK